MQKEDVILINKYGQSLVSTAELKKDFLNFSVEEKRKYLTEVVGLIGQSKPNNDDVDTAIFESGLKPTYTPCVLLKKGVATHNLNKIIQLPENELEKVLLLFLSLFRISYQRRFRIERNNPNKWWYWDLSIKENVEKVLRSEI